MNQQTFTLVTFGYLRREAKGPHLYCSVCHEREFDVSQPPFAQMSDATVVPTLRQVMVCSKVRPRERLVGAGVSRRFEGNPSQAAPSVHSDGYFLFKTTAASFDPEGCGLPSAALRTTEAT